jgi:hypothetical protein
MLNIHSHYWPCVGNVANFKYLETTLTDQYCIHEEINRRINLGNV